MKTGTRGQSPLVSGSSFSQKTQHLINKIESSKYVSFMRGSFSLLRCCLSWNAGCCPSCRDASQDRPRNPTPVSWPLVVGAFRHKNFKSFDVHADHLYFIFNHGYMPCSLCRSCSILALNIVHIKELCITTLFYHFPQADFTCRMVMWKEISMLQHNLIHYGVHALYTSLIMPLLLIYLKKVLEL